MYFQKSLIYFQDTQIVVNENHEMILSNVEDYFAIIFKGQFRTSVIL